MLRKTLAVILIAAGALLVYFGRSEGTSPQVFTKHQREEVNRIEKAPTIGKCPPGAVIRFLGHAEPINEGVSDKVLDSGVVGHFPKTGPVGVGNYALTAHVVTHGEPFRYMPNLVKGDRVTITKCGTTYTFKVDRKYEVYYTDIDVLNAHPKMLTLITCASRFVHTDYRTIVRAHLVDVQQVQKDTPRQVHRSA